MESKIVIFVINGGIGKSVMATAVCEAIASFHKDRKLVVVTAYPEIFLNNPHIYRVYRSGVTPYFHDDYVQGKDSLFLLEDPYQSHDYIVGSKHLIETWCEAIRVPYDGQQPKLYLTPREAQLFANQFQRDKPVLLFQPFGGAEQQAIKYSWNRDLPPQQATRVVDCVADKYHVIQPKREGQIAVAGAEQLTVNIRELIGLVMYAKAIIGIDSCVQHIAAALGKPATVCWITNSPKVFGYNLHNNILPSAKLLPHISGIDGFCQRYDFTGSRLHDFPYEVADIFNVTEIVKNSLKT